MSLAYCRQISRTLINIPPSLAWLSLEKTPTSVKNIRESIFNQLLSAHMPEKFHQTCAKFAKRTCLAVQKAELYKTKMKKTTAAKNAWKSQQGQANKV